MPSKATRYEKQKAKEHRGKHVGGPGQHDYYRGSKPGEVKNRQGPVTGPEVRRMARRGVKEIDSKGGFTGPAVETAKKLGIKYSRDARR